MDPLTMSILITAASKAVGKIAGRFVKVEEPMKHYRRLLGQVRREEIPGYLSPEEIREMSYAGASAYGATANVEAAAAVASKAGKPAIHANRAARSIEMNIGRNLQAVNSVLKVEDARRRISEVRQSLHGQMKQQELSDAFKSSLADAAAMRGVTEYEGQARKRAGVEGTVTAGLSIAGLLTSDAGFREWIGKLFSTAESSAAPVGSWDMEQVGKLEGFDVT